MIVHHRFGVVCSQPELEAVWRSLLRNRDNTVHYQEFMRHFTDKPSPERVYTHTIVRIIIHTTYVPVVIMPLFSA